MAFANIKCFFPTYTEPCRNCSQVFLKARPAKFRDYQVFDFPIVCEICDKIIKSNVHVTYVCNWPENINLYRIPLTGNSIDNYPVFSQNHQSLNINLIRNLSSVFCRSFYLALTMWARVGRGEILTVVYLCNRSSKYCSRYPHHRPIGLLVSVLLM